MIIWISIAIFHRLSTSGCRILLTKILKYSYKKAYKITKKTVEGDRKRDFYEAAHIQYCLESQEYNIIFLDEFHISIRSENIYNWSPRKVSSIVAVDPDPWSLSLSFIIAFSKTRIEGIVESNYSINTNVFIFLSKWYLDSIGKEQ